VDLKTHRALGCELCFIGVGLLKPWSQLPLGDSCVEDGNVAADSEVLASQSSVHVLAA
jgi:hypothetical protein